jgi:hypothetical protein
MPSDDRPDTTHALVEGKYGLPSALCSAIAASSALYHPIQGASRNLSMMKISTAHARK